MSLTELVHTLAKYNAELNLRLWDSIQQLTDEQFVAPVAYSHGSVRNQIVHLSGVTERWLRGLKGLPDRPDLLPKPGLFPTRASVQALWSPVEADFLSHVLALDEGGLEFAPPGLGRPAWQVVMHILNHATDHRAQILRALHDFGAPTFDQDLIMYLWAH